MEVVVVSLDSMLNNKEYDEEQIQGLLLTFSAINKPNCDSARDVKEFLSRVRV